MLVPIDEGLRVLSSGRRHEGLDKNYCQGLGNTCQRRELLKLIAILFQNLYVSQYYVSLS